MFQFTWPLCTPPMFKFGPRGFQNWFYIHFSSNQKKVPSGQTFFPRQIGPNWRLGLCKTTVPNYSTAFNLKLFISLNYITIKI